MARMLAPKRWPLSLAAQASVRHVTNVLQAPPAAPTQTIPAGTARVRGIGGIGRAAVSA
jgi:hypothetical protein